MLRVTQRQLEELQLIYGKLQAIPTRHNIFVIGTNEEIALYKRALVGNLSQKQQKRLSWAKRHI